jgi:hypothetical protein
MPDSEFYYFTKQIEIQLVYTRIFDTPKGFYSARLLSEREKMSGI